MAGPHRSWEVAPSPNQWWATLSAAPVSIASRAGPAGIRVFAEELHLDPVFGEVSFAEQADDAARPESLGKHGERGCSPPESGKISKPRDSR